MKERNVKNKDFNKNSKRNRLIMKLSFKFKKLKILRQISLTKELINSSKKLLIVEGELVVNIKIFTSVKR